MRETVRRISILSLAALLGAGPAWAQTAAQTPPPAPTTPQAPEQAPSEPLSADHLARIRQGLTHESALKLENGQMMIYVEVIAKWPSFAEVAKGYDLLHGPTGGGNPMSHQEFLNMVTPQEMYGSGGISAPEVLTMALVNYFGQKAIAKGLKEISQTRDQKKIDQIRAQIDAELAAIRGGK
jgi:hypothetical protein